MMLCNRLEGPLAEGGGPDQRPWASSNSTIQFVDMLHEARLMEPGRKEPDTGNGHSPLVPKDPKQG